MSTPDLDGSVDDPQLGAAMTLNGVGIDIFLSETSNAAQNYETNNGAVLYLTEIDPNNPGIFQKDATFEEVIHNINSAQTELYPGDLGLNSGSKLGMAMNTARGGNFINVPSNYPLNAWFTYDDETCEYECQMIEYLYWGIGTYLGFFDDSEICPEFAHEWKICSAEELNAKDPALYAIITDPKLLLPRNKPGNKYVVRGTDTATNIAATTSAAFSTSAEFLFLIIAFANYYF